MQMNEAMRNVGLIIDEPDGREAAKRQGLRVIGTLRVLYDAAEAGLCELEQTYDDLQQTTFRAHPQLFRAFLDAHFQSRESSSSQGG